MNCGKPTRSLALSMTCGLVFAAAAAAADPPGTTLVEHVSQWWPKGQGGSLGTIFYLPSQKERPFFDRLSAAEVATGSQSVPYDLSTRDKKYVGVVRNHPRNR